MNTFEVKKKMTKFYEQNNRHFSRDSLDSEPRGRKRFTSYCFSSFFFVPLSIQLSNKTNQNGCVLFLSFMISLSDFFYNAVSVYFRSSSIKDKVGDSICTLMSAHEVNPNTGLNVH